MTKQSITAIVLTYNEEIHLERCLQSLNKVCERIVVVDSFSTDNTLEIARSNGAEFFQNTWVNYAVQFNWALDNLKVNTDWVLRLDADEYLSEYLLKELKNNLSEVKNDVNGITFPLRRVFLNREIKFGTGNIRLLRMFRTGKGRSENRWMDEHINLLEGKITEFQGSFSDDNLNNLSWWTQKHIGYAIREAIDLLDIELSLLSKSKKETLDTQALQKRNLKHKYVKQPLFLRAFIYFLYRYIFKLGFLEGKEGFLWHFLQGWWYRTLVDAKVYEIKKVCGDDVHKIKAHLKEHYQIEL
ncbi:glycosyltransferase family 2 protein [Tamlana sp. s12]|uniref:glycosyltransferase family 2 protein n=1 Tax=Tamlana sp. s12 TaxID=1630406 RepID=UPI0007FB7DA4|nr:glycosyltransferase family 2 protein [Tamlana sp. s12]OBQ55589.1 hypothetical protein VQ01_09135 [Tamlana sp. s12]QQY83732.1 glycosyltransferase family 2 protein [Tamlana sp. s12]